MKLLNGGSLKRTSDDCSDAYDAYHVATSTPPLKPFRGKDQVGLEEA